MAALLVAVVAACRGSEPSRGEVPGHGSPVPAAAEPHTDDLAALQRYEEERRRRTDFAALPDATSALGSNPYQLQPIGDGSVLVGILRGAGAVVLIDRRGRELARATAPPSPTALAVDRSGRILVGGTGSGAIAMYRADGASSLVRTGELAIAGAWTVRALATGPGDWVYAADQRTGALTALELTRAGRAAHERRIDRCRSPIQLAVVAGWLVADCVAEHSLLAYALDPRGAPIDVAPVRMSIDGPFWSVAAASSGDRALVAAGGIEDHPLERQSGGFGYIDSFLYLYELPRARGEPARRIAAVNLGAAGVVTPKWVRLELTDGGGAVVRTAGYATASLVTLTWPTVTADAAPAVESRRFAPGTTDWSPAAGGGAEVAASPLLDGWVVTGPGGGAPVIAPAAPASGTPQRSTESRVGEALFFTTLMSPWNRSDGKLSRFTCETCHFEAYGDGRVHFTGRGTVHSATKPLRGLFNNRPHFTRALDRTMARMVHAEFRVANRWSGRDPWFSLAAADFPWLAVVDGVPATMSPMYLRRSFMSFLMDLTFEPNQAVRGRERFSAREREGAGLFRERCASCHRARTITEEPASEVPFDRWERLVFSTQGPIVWASAEYQKTGIEPYVHQEGARTTSLRRAYQKYPYFTNGSARSLDEIVERAAWANGRFFHDRAPTSGHPGRFSAEQRAALVAFLELL